MSPVLPRRARWEHPRVVARALVAALAGVASVAGASEPRTPAEPRVLEQPAHLTNVLDAFDDGGIDLHFTLGYEQTYKSALILRETHSAALASDGYTSARLGIGHFSENTSRLHARGAVGLYRDVQLVIRAPVVLSHRHELDGVSGSEAVQGIVLEGAPGQQLFSLPFKSPARSGLEYLGVGFDFGLFNQWREPTAPTVLVGVEGRFSVSEPLHACAPRGVARCAYPSDINRDGRSGQFQAELAPGRSEPLEGTGFNGARKPGVSRGTTGIELHANASRRFRSWEPYVGLSVLFELPNAGSDFQATVGPGADPRLPLRKTMMLGAELMPWEVVERFQRLSVDLRFTGSHVSRGLDYSELFDALGSSDALGLRQPNFARYRTNPDAATAAQSPSVIDPDAARVFTTGITEVEGHVSYGVRLAVRWQAGRYVSFALGGSWLGTQAHLVTLGQACRGGSRDLAGAGPCITGETGNWRATGKPDPSFRPEISAPGRRFKVDTATTLDTWANATVMF
jgi:hypothetical protein